MREGYEASSMGRVPRLICRLKEDSICSSSAATLTLGSNLHIRRAVDKYVRGPMPIALALRRLCAAYRSYPQSWVGIAGVVGHDSEVLGSVGPHLSIGRPQH